MERYTVFPPRWRHLRVPSASRGAALATLAMWSPCRPGGLALQRAAWTAVRLAGPAVLPGHRVAWEPPAPPGTWSRLERTWRDVVGLFDALGVYERAQQHRTGVALLLIHGGTPVGFVKLRREGTDEVAAGMAAEHEVLGVVAAAADPAFVAPAPLAVGTCDGWSYLVTTAVGDGLDRPPVGVDVTPVVDAVGSALSGMSRPAGTPEGWQPMHGDLTPWNLRVRPDGVVTIVDWEDARWAPPGADSVLLHATLRAMYGTEPPPVPQEAVEYWRQQIAGRPRDTLDDQLSGELLGALRLM